MISICAVKTGGYSFIIKLRLGTKNNSHKECLPKHGMAKY